ncbi:MAG: uracil-DNA glycosylase [Chloroflexi bacterium]|nr:uracil-DNA glycosylase [Chloroflexota bacterium]
MEELDRLAEEIRQCQRCRLGATRTHAVPGEGDSRAEVMFIGEAPGFHEDQQGRPFVGAAGQLLNELLAGIGLRREQVFIANVLKCRPPGNRDPFPDEIATCAPYLDRQLELIRPRVIVTLGRFSMAKIFPNPRSMREMHGRTVEYRGSTVMAAYHPAAVFRQQGLKAVLEEDFRRIPELVRAHTAKRPKREPTAPDARRDEPPASEQLSLF